MGNRYKANQFAVAVWEMVAKLEDEEEVTRLLRDAQGRRAFPSLLVDVLFLRLCRLFEKSC